MSERPMTIAVYSGEIPSTTFIERLIVGLANTGTSIFLFGATKKKTTYPPNVRVVSYTHQRFVKLIHLLKYSLLLTVYRLKDKRKLDAIIRQRSKNRLYAKVKFYPVLWHRPDIFHLQWAKGVEEWHWVQDFGMKLVVSLRGAHINYSPIADPDLAAMYRRHFPKVDGFHAVSKAIAKEAQKYGAAPDKIQVVYSGLQLEPIQKIKEKKNQVIKIVSVGRPHWIKGYTYALDACKILKQRDVQFGYDIIGGSTDIELQYQINDLDLQNEVRLLGPSSFEKVAEKVAAADLLLVSSTKEGIANVVLEAMALGTLVLTTDCGGMREVVTHGENGFIVPIRDSQRMAEAIISIGQLTEEQRTAIITNAHDTITRNHTEAQMVEGMRGLYGFVMK